MDVFGLIGLAALLFLPSCKVVAIPFRVAGAVVDTGYQGGKKVVDASSEAKERRKLKKQREEEEKAKAEAKGQMKKDQAPLTPPDAIQPGGEPAIPIGPTDPNLQLPQ